MGFTSNLNLHIKGNHFQSYKTVYIMVENLCKVEIGQEINIQNVQELQNINP
jgi:hypothetical protein